MSHCEVPFEVERSVWVGAGWRGCLWLDGCSVIEVILKLINFVGVV